MMQAVFCELGRSPCNRHLCISPDIAALKECFEFVFDLLCQSLLWLQYQINHSSSSSSSSFNQIAYRRYIYAVPLVVQKIKIRGTLIPYS